MSRRFYCCKDCKKGEYKFHTSENEIFIVTSFEDGIATLESIYVVDIKNFCALIEDCFCDDSYFKFELLQAYDCMIIDSFKGIRFKFNGAEVLVTKEDADKERIYEKWKKAREKKSEKLRIEEKVYMKSPEYRINIKRFFVNSWGINSEKDKEQ